jgi:hypothetical protein
MIEAIEIVKSLSLEIPKHRLEIPKQSQYPAGFYWWDWSRVATPP